MTARPEDSLPPDSAIVVAFTCGGCGTHYRWSSRTFERTRIRRSTGDGIEIAPGETKHLDAEIT